MDVPHRRDRQLPGPLNVSPHQESIWRIKRKPSACVGLNDCLRIIAEEQEGVVQAPIRAGAYVRAVQQEASGSIARCNLELTIGVVASVRERNNARVACAYRRYDEVLGGIAIFVSHANAEAVRNLSLEFHIPCSAARVLQAPCDAIDIRRCADHLPISAEVRYR